MEGTQGSVAAGFLGNQVDLERGLVRREIFFDHGIYRQELERVFARSWLFVAHESQVPNPGDFVLGRMAEESVIVNRDQQNRIHVLLNNCSHRGMRVCRYDEGNARYFTCPYHGWTFGNDGALETVPKFKSAYHEKLDRARWHLPQARVANWRGLVFACWDERAPSFEAFMGPALFFLDDFVEQYDGGDGSWEACGGILKWKIPCNWKFGAENFSGDYYHQPSHASVDRVILSPAGKPGRHTYDLVTEREKPWKLNLYAEGTGHTSRGQLFKSDNDYVPTYGDMPVVEDYFREAFYKRRERLGEKARWFGHGGTIFPNLSYSNGVMSLGVWHPDGPERCEVWRVFLVPKDAPAEVKDVMRHYAIRYQGPSGLTEQDDMENWNYAHVGARGMVGQRIPYNYEMGMGAETRGWPAAPWLGSAFIVTEEVTEQNQREFYRQWAAQMDSPPMSSGDAR